MCLVRRLPAWLTLVLALSWAGCGSKTGLGIPDFELGADGGADGRVCVSERDPLEQRIPEVLFVVDQSRSMEFGLDGSTDPPREDSRWVLLGDSLVRALEERGDGFSFGALLFPDAPTPIRDIQEACSLNPGIDLPIGRGNLGRLRRVFEDGDPSGGTPTALALMEARAQFTDPLPGVQRFVVLATDGAPNCNPNPPVPPPDCVCTGDSSMTCEDPETGPYQCLDDVNAIAAVQGLADEDGIPVYVIGIEDPTKPEYRSVLDAMAVAGRRPRPEGAERYYDVREPEDLDRALAEITESLARCVYYLGGAIGAEDVGSVRIGSTTLPLDPSGIDGWSLSNPVAGEITLHGSACALAEVSDEPLAAFGECL